MSRSNENLGEIAQSPRGIARGAAVAARAGASGQLAESIEKSILPKRRTLRGLCCKTCKGESCTGHCKF